MRHLQTTEKHALAQRRRAGEYVPSDPLLTAAEAAAERGQAVSTFWRDVKAGRVPLAYYVSPKAPRWRRSELLAALEACRASAPAKPLDHAGDRATRR